MTTPVCCYIKSFIVHSTKLLVSDWTRAVQLILNCTLKEYLLGFYGNECFRRSSEDFQRVQNSPKGIRRFQKMTEPFRRFPKITRSPPNILERDRKVSKYFRSSPEDCRRPPDVFIALILPFMLLTSNRMISCEILSFPSFLKLMS